MKKAAIFLCLLFYVFQPSLSLADISDYETIKGRVNAIGGKGWVIFDSGFEGLFLYLFNQNNEVVLKKVYKGSDSGNVMGKIISLIQRNRLDRLEKYLFDQENIAFKTAVNAKRDPSLLIVKTEEQPQPSGVTIHLVDDKPADMGKELGDWLNSFRASRADITASVGCKFSSNKSFSLKSGEKIIGIIDKFENGVYSIESNHGKIKISDDQIISINSEEKDDSPYSSLAKLNAFHKESVEVILTLCSQISSGLNLISAIPIFAESKGKLDAISRKYPDFSTLSLVYEVCFKVLKLPFDLKSADLGEASSSSKNILCSEIQAIANSKIWLVKGATLNRFKSALPAIYSSAQFKYTSEYKTSALVEAGLPLIKEQLSEISKILEPK